MVLRRVVAVFGVGLLAATLAACPASNGGDGTDGTDGTDGGTGPDIPAPAEPAPPASRTRPTLGPCPPGWRTVPPADETDVETCGPWPAEPPECTAVDEASFPGETACARVGRGCPSGDWPDDLPADGVTYALAGAAIGGTGTRAAPFATIGEALAAAPAGSTVAVGKGTYDEVVRLWGRITLRGACAAETVVASTTPGETQGTVTANGAGGELVDLRIGGARPGVWIPPRATVRVEGVVVADAESAGIYVEAGGRLEGRELLVRGTRSQARDGEYGSGIAAEPGATVDLQRVALEANHTAGLEAIGVEATLSDVVVRDTEGTASDRRMGRGVLAQEGAVVTLTRAIVVGNRDVGVYAAGSGTSVTLTDAVVRETRGRASDGLRGRGLSLTSGAQGTLDRVLLEANLDIGAFVGDAGTAARFSDTVIRGTGATGDGGGGRGVSVQNGATLEADRLLVAGGHEDGIYATAAVLTLRDVEVRDVEAGPAGLLTGRGIELVDGTTATAERALVERTTEAGILVGGPGATATLTDATVRGTRTRPDGGSGRGIEASGGAGVTLVRARIAESASVGLFADGEGTAVTAEDLTIVDGVGDGRGLAGQGLHAARGAEVSVVRARLERTRNVGIVAGLASRISLEDVAVIDTVGRVYDGLGGRGLTAQEASRIEGRRVRLEGNRELGIAAIDEGTAIVLREVVVRDTRERDCAATFCPERAAGIGAGAFGGAWIELTTFLVADSALAGVMLGPYVYSIPPSSLGGTMDLHEGQVSGNPVGANVQNAEFDVGRLMDRVIYRDNDRDLDTDLLPVPELTVPDET